MAEPDGDVPMRTSDDVTISNLYDPEYRAAMAEDFLSRGIAAQIRALREGRSWTQAKLATEADMTQPRISALEAFDYSAWSVRTLVRLAKAFDVRLVVEFRSFSKLFQGRTVPPDLETFEKREFSEPPFTEDHFFHSQIIPGAMPDQARDALARWEAGPR